MSYSMVFALAAPPGNVDTVRGRALGENGLSLSRLVHSGCAPLSQVTLTVSTSQGV